MNYLMNLLEFLPMTTLINFGGLESKITYTFYLFINLLILKSDKLIMIHYFSMNLLFLIFFFQEDFQPM
jgi:hypothetical protein